jgi:evolved beta-galactosidase subunit alpha
MEGDICLQSGVMQLPSIPARSEADIVVPYQLGFEPIAGAKYYINFSYRLNRDTMYAKAGYELATAQFELPIHKDKYKVAPIGKLSITKEPTMLHIIGNNFSVSFDLVRGTMLNVVCDGVTILEKGPKLNLWRAPIDNDMDELVPDYKTKYFLHLQHEVVQDIQYSIENNHVEVQVNTLNGTTNGAWHYLTKYLYKIYPTGDIAITVSGVPSGKLDCAPKVLPKIGVTMHISKELSNVRWFGRGPGETYVDSKEAGLFGLYQRTVDEMFTNYVHPQENGNHIDTSWASFTNDRGMGLVATAEDTFNFSAQYYEDQDIELAKHTCNLKKRDYIVLDIDYKQNGLGSNSCGQRQLEKYQCKFEPFTLSFKLTAYNNKEKSDKNIAREIICD